MTQSTLLYDETCGFCTRVAQWVGRQSHANQLAIMPCQFAMTTGRFQVTEQDCLTSIQLFHGTDAPLQRGQAFAQVLSIVWDTKWPARIAGLPLVRQALDLGYSFVAVNRHRLPGIKQMCAADGSSCDQDSQSP